MIKAFKKVSSVLVLSIIITFAAMFTTVCYAEEINSTVSNEKLGTTYLDINPNDTQTAVQLEGESIYADGKYDMTWEISDSNGINDAEMINLVIKNNEPYPLGISGELSLEINEIWIDGVKLDEDLNGKPVYSQMMDYIYDPNEITGILFNLRTSSFNDLNTTINENIRIVFTLSNLTDISTYTTETTTTETTTTEATTTTETTTTAATTTSETTTIDTTTTSKTTTTVPIVKNSPKTGDNGIGSMLLVILISGITACAFKSRNRI